MNRHVNKNKHIKQPYPARTGVPIDFAETDAMPKEVAIELLCAPKARITNRERKMYQRARYTVYASTLQPKAPEEVLARRMKSSTWAQLANWHRRALGRRAELQHAYILAVRRRDKLQATEIPDGPYADSDKARLDFQLAILARTIAGIDLRASQLDTLRDVIEDEQRRRQEA